jgi:dolichyl-phosphate beta-glucosyltransferase
MAPKSTAHSAAPAAPATGATATWSRVAPAFGRLTLVLPAYNEAARIGPALDELFAWLAGPAASAETPLPPRIRVLVVDDGSTDRTAHLVLDRPESGVPEDALLRLELLRVPHGGKGAAVRAGMLAGDGDVLVFADADMATPPHQLPKLLAALAGSGETPGADVALGSRIQPDGSDMRASQPGYRRLLGRVFHALASIWVVGPVQDTQCGFKGFRREAAREIFSRQLITSIVFDVELIHLARRLGCRLAIVPVQWSDVHGSRMHPGLRLAVRVGWDLFRIPLLHRRVRG